MGGGGILLYFLFECVSGHRPTGQRKASLFKEHLEEPLLENCMPSPGLN